MMYCNGAKIPGRDRLCQENLGWGGACQSPWQEQRGSGWQMVM